MPLGKEDTSISLTTPDLLLTTCCCPSRLTMLTDAAAGAVMLRVVVQGLGEIVKALLSVTTGAAEDPQEFTVTNA